ncbi:hypothetical protein PSH79_24160 [Pseudomonas sp. FP2196]|uniref:hypothetical protein n=1 Tax=Pseudomonas sp. FP2196 TaxID=2954086 RepID=UPI00273653B9|nr:hypothetical protein [Pseudomonas sp. FP2196]WLH34977.1 hypothetical protein PSH79_24160 [Pseudomonas sp. FP2196]
MSPKIPRKAPVSTIQTTELNIPLTRQPDFIARRLPESVDAPFSIHSDQQTVIRPDNEHNPSPAVRVTEIPTRGSAVRSHERSIDELWLPDNFLRGMQAADAEGWRYIVGRKFVDIEHEGVLRTAHADFDDELKAHRMKSLQDRYPLGPVIYKNNGRPTWRLTVQESEIPAIRPEPKDTGSDALKRPHQPASEQPNQPAPPKKPRPAEEPTFIDPNRYKESHRSPDSQGYYELEPRLGISETQTRFAFRDKYGRWIQVDPPPAGFGLPPTHLKHWTDQEIWEAYAIQGQDIERFRVQAQATGKPPLWVEPRETGDPVVVLVRDSLRWLHPAMTTKERQTLLQSYNLLPSQLTRLQQDLKTALAMPEWATAHKRLMEDTANPHRLDAFSQQAIQELNLKREARHDWYYPESSMTDELREALLAKMGYLRNAQNCLYRTDVPALFRGDDRTPFELANDDAMLPRYAHEPGATTHKPMSATFSLQEGQKYASAPDPEYLRFNSQTNKYPGRAGDDTPPNSDASEHSDSSSSSDWSDAGSPVALDRERNYERTRERQTHMFLYVLDTRQLEVVPHEENHLFNSSARSNQGTWFPTDDYEGLISVTRRGLDADRIWLLNSTLTKAALVHDIREQAGRNASRIESTTHAGHSNQDEYDRLINAVDVAGKPILKLSGNKNEFGYDITWPE